MNHLRRIGYDIANKNDYGFDGNEKTVINWMISISNDHRNLEKGSPLVKKSMLLACLAYTGMKRHDGEPCIYHPMRIAALAQYLKPENERVISASLISSILCRKPEIPKETIISITSPDVYALSKELIKPSKFDKTLSCEKAYEMDLRHFSSISEDAKFIKSLDIFDKLHAFPSVSVDRHRIFLKNKRDQITALISPDVTTLGILEADTYILNAKMIVKSH